MSNLLIKNKSTAPLSLNENESLSSKKYIFEGLFTLCDGVTKNRNERIYDQQEVLPHLAYLRDKIKEDGYILGELDHPEGRFEVYLKEASHKITDLWFDPQKKAVMGKLELLDTPNGKTAKAIVDAGYPLYVSSRAAGTVNANSHVTIQQIFTYDIVCTPGFKEARLDRVDESMKPQVMAFLNESEKKVKSLNEKLGISDKNTIVLEGESSFKVKDTTNFDYSNDDLTKPINEDIKVKVSPEKAQELGLKLGNDNNASQDNNGGEQPSQEKHTADEILEIKPTYAEQDPSAIQDIQPEFVSPENSQDSNGASETQQNNQNPFMTESKKAKKGDNKKEGEEIEKTSYDEKIDISEEGEKPNPVADGKLSSETDKIVDKSHKKEEKEEKDGEVIDEACDGDDCSNDKNVKKLKDKKEDIKESTDHLIDFYENLLAESEVKNKIRQKIYESYPFSVSLSPENFDKFLLLNDEDKKACADFIKESETFDIQKINNIFMRPLMDKMNEQKNYIRLADKSDLDLYFAAPDAIRESIDKSAELFILESKEDVDEFWSRTGIRNYKLDEIQNEAFVEDFNKKMAVSEKEQQTPFGYNANFINQIGKMM